MYLANIYSGDWVGKSYEKTNNNKKCWLNYTYDDKMPIRKAIEIRPVISQTINNGRSL